MTPDIDLGRLTHAEKDALILGLFARIEALEKRVEELTRRILPVNTAGDQAATDVTSVLRQFQGSNSSSREAG